MDRWSGCTIRWRVGMKSHRVCDRGRRWLVISSTRCTDSASSQHIPGLLKHGLALPSFSIAYQFSDLFQTYRRI
jgi:hypothetical protein